MNRKIILLPVFIIISFVIGFIYLIKGCLSSHNTYGVVGRPAISKDGKTVTVLVAVSEATSYQENGGYRSTSYNTSYWLKQYETASGKLLQKKKIVSGAEKSNLLANCFGAFADVIWLHTNGLKGYSLATLEEVVNEEKLAAANGFNKNNFPQELRFIDEAVTKGYINFTAENGEKYSIDLASQKITAYTETEDDKEAMVQAILRRYSQAGDYHGTRCDTANNDMFVLAKDSAQAVECRPGDNMLTDVAYRMHLFKNGYTVKRLGNHNSFDIKRVTKVGSTSYLNPCFASDVDLGNAIRFSQPPGYLIIHQDVVSSNAKAILTRIDTVNNKVWETATGFSTKIGQCMVSNNFCVITSNASYMISPHIGKDVLCIVDTETGKMSLPVLRE